VSAKCGDFSVLARKGTPRRGPLGAHRLISSLPVVVLVCAAIFAEAWRGLDFAARTGFLGFIFVFGIFHRVAVETESRQSLGHHLGYKVCGGRCVAHLVLIHSGLGLKGHDIRAGQSPHGAHYSPVLL